MAIYPFYTTLIERQVYLIFQEIIAEQANNQLE